MSATLIPRHTQIPHEELSALVSEYALSQELPPADWMTRLNLSQPRDDIRSLSETTRIAKRAVDIVISAIMLALLAPLLGFVALVVKLTSPGPVIYRQQRVGLNLRKHADRRGRTEADGAAGPSNRRSQKIDRRKKTAYGRPFVLYKFRTMSVDAERNGARFAVTGDPRLTPVGGFLRKTRLDELPQLWNVLKGEMSLVGPRPERAIFIEELSQQIPDYLQRLGLKPGLTGLAQVLNGYDNNLEGFRRKVALDLLYLQNCCLWNDLKIMARTVGVVLTGRGAV